MPRSSKKKTQKDGTDQKAKKRKTGKEESSQHNGSISEKTILNEEIQNIQNETITNEVQAGMQNEEKTYQVAYNNERKQNEITPKEEIINVEKNKSDSENNNSLESKNMLESENRLENKNSLDSKNRLDNKNSVENKNRLDNKNSLDSKNSLDNKNSLENKNKERGKICPYLGTVNRNLLDFDFEKLCSCSLTNLHVYACLVCGIYFQGIGKNTHAYKHSLEKNHYVFINLENCKTYCVPENYEIEDASLNDIKYFLKPFYTKKQVEEFCKTPILGKSLDGADFIPGCIGLNNLKNTDYCNVIIQLLCSVAPLRNVLLLMEDKKNNAKSLIVVLSELIKKMYNPQNFKGVVSPHEFLQTVGIESNKNFKIGTKKDPYDFFCWLINKIHRYSKKKLKKTKKTQKKEENDDQKKENENRTEGKEKEKEVELIKWSYENENIIDYCFDGELLVKTKIENTISENVHEIEKSNITVGNRTEQIEEEQDEDGNIFKITKVPFRTLSLTLPNVPIFKNVTESNIIPQVSIFELLAKFDGETESILSNEKNPCTLSISKLPKYLIFTFKRFSKNNFFVEKNGTIVNFVMKNLDMKEYIHPHHIEQNPVTKYDLIANIFHSGTVNQGIYKIHVLNQSMNEWYEIEDLHVTSVLPQLILLSESCMQLYQRHDVKYNGDLGSVL